ncbi:hypothetical protein WMY93_020594 [Mugilogobius chulae]|uniref:Uncharacterized protein n=1 Tax=Mugilogobius chulae TaxID=88201 RepID=A0AAW0NJG2_9GOBI
MHGGFHPKSRTLRLYASRKEGGRGLVSVRVTIQDETSEIHKYIKDKAPTDGVLSECLRQWGTDDEVLEEEPSWEDKPLHGMYHRNITEVADLKKSYQWLERAGLKDSTEALILAAQEQALSTRAIEAQIYHTRQDPRCRLCKEAPETVQHITAGCKMLAGKAYMERHNQVAGIVYRNICAEYGLETPSSKWETPPKVVENDRAKILWDFQIQTDRMVMNQPDIVVVVDKEQRRAVVVDVAIPSDGNIRRKEHEKLEKYQGLREELEKAWKVKATVVPVVIGALGAVTPKLDEWLQHIPGSTSDISVQKSAVLGTARILRRGLPANNNMSGGGKRKTRGNPQGNAIEEDLLPGEVDVANKLTESTTMEAIQANIIAELKKVQDDLKKDFNDRMDALKTEVSGYREEMGRRMDGFAADMKEVTERVSEAEQRVADMEEFNVDVKDALGQALQLQLELQTRITDLEARSRRNNIRIHGIAEGAEGTNVQVFVEDFLKSELPLASAALAIQRCHRSLGPKPPPTASPRSIVICFQEYKVKETVLCTAWAKRDLEFQGRRVFFDHDYPSDILFKRKAYNPVRKMLKERGHRFQTLYPARLRVLYNGEGGGDTVVYNSVEEVNCDLKKRGLFEAAHEDSTTAAPATRPRRPAATWESGRQRSKQAWSREELTKSIREKLKMFKSNTV